MVRRIGHGTRGIVELDAGGLDDEALVMSVSQRKMAIQCRVQVVHLVLRS